MNITPPFVVEVKSPLVRKLVVLALTEKGFKPTDGFINGKYNTTGNFDTFTITERRLIELNNGQLLHNYDKEIIRSFKIKWFEADHSLTSFIKFLSHPPKVVGSIETSNGAALTYEVDEFTTKVGCTTFRNETLLAFAKTISDHIVKFS